jgi:hypothetical protein
LKKLVRLVCYLLPFAGYAQNIDLDHPNNYSTYALEVKVPGNVLKSVSQATIESAIAIRGLKKVTDSPSLTVCFNSEDLVISQEGVKEYVEAPKTGDGNDTTRKTSYYVEAIYSLRCEGKCYTAQKQLVYSAIFGTGQNKYISSFMTSRKQAEDYWNNNKETLETNFIASIINPSIIALGNKLNAVFHKDTSDR